MSRQCLTIIESRGTRLEEVGADLPCGTISEMPVRQITNRLQQETGIVPRRTLKQAAKYAAVDSLTPFVSSVSICQVDAARLDSPHTNRTDAGARLR
jgi:hypothetical protein